MSQSPNLNNLTDEIIAKVGDVRLDEAEPEGSERNPTTTAVSTDTPVSPVGGAEYQSASGSVAELKHKPIESLFEDKYQAFWSGTRIYRCWQDLLDKWCTDDYDVYLVSPFFEKLYIEAAYKLFNGHRPTRQGNLHIYTRQATCRNFYNKDEVKKANDWDTYVRNLSGSVDINVPAKYKYFHGKFMAGVPKSGERKIELMITSANFTAEHFREFENEDKATKAKRIEENHDTVSFSRMTYSDFHDNFLQTLNKDIQSMGYIMRHPKPPNHQLKKERW